MYVRSNPQPGCCCNPFYARILIERSILRAAKAWASQ